jgi:hypothetical protein
MSSFTKLLPSINLFRPEGFKWTHVDKTATYNFYENGGFKSSNNRSGTWSLENQPEKQVFLKIVFNSAKLDTIYFKWSLQFGINLSILEKQTGYKNTEHVSLLC